MTISSTTRKAGPFIGNGTTTAFPFAYKVFQASDLLVVRLDTTLNIEHELTLNTDYTVTLNLDQDSNPGGTVNLLAALATGYTLTLTSDLANLQPTDLTNQGGFYPDVINDALDRATIQIQQLQEQTDRSLKVAVSSTADATLPPPAPNDLIGWDATGNALVNVDPGSLATVVAYATAYCDVFIGNGITTSWTLTRDPGVLYNLDVSINGSSQEPTRDYTLSGTTFTMTTPPPIGARVVVKYKEGLPNFNGDSQDVRFVPGLTGSATRSVQSKLRDMVSVKDFGAKGDGITNDTAAFQAALNYAASINGCEIWVPAGVYICAGQLSLQTPIGVSLIGEGVDNTQLGGSRIRYTGTASPFFEFKTPNARMFTIRGVDFQYSNPSFSGTLLKMPGFDMKMQKCHLGGYGGANNALYLLDIDESVDVHLDQVRFGAARYGLHGMTASGFANAVLLSQCSFSGPSLANMLNTGQGWTLNGCSMEPQANNLANGIEIETSTTPQGLNIIGCWFGDVIDTPTSPPNQWIKWKGQGLFMSGNYINGAGYHTIDAVRVIGEAKGIVIIGNHIGGFGAALNLGTGLASEVVMIGNQYDGVDNFTTGTLASGTMLCPEWVYAIPGDMQITGGFKTTTNFTSKSASLALDAPNAPAVITRGTYPDGTAGAVLGEYLRHQHSTAAPWHCALSTYRGTYANNIWWKFTIVKGSAETDALYITADGTIPGADNGYTLGSAANRWSTVYAATGTINTSDAREKQQIRSVSDAEHAVAVRLKNLIKAFKFNDAVEKKGDGARIHFGLIAQEVIEAFAQEGLDATQYALLCYDEWEEHQVTVHETSKTLPNGEVVVDVPEHVITVPAGNRYGIRYEELLAFLLAAL